jgi:hypothetical protein
MISRERGALLCWVVLFYDETKQTINIRNLTTMHTPRRLTPKIIVVALAAGLLALAAIFVAIDIGVYFERPKTFWVTEQQKPTTTSPFFETIPRPTIGTMPAKATSTINWEPSAVTDKANFAARRRVENRAGDLVVVEEPDLVVLDWLPASGAETYVVFRGSSGTGPWIEYFRRSNERANGIDYAPSASDRCYRVEALDRTGAHIRSYQTICLPPRQ